MAALSGAIALGVSGADRATAQGGEGQEPTPGPHAQVVSPEDLGSPDNLTVVGNPGEVLPAAELKVGDRFYLDSIGQEVTVMYVDRYMILLMPDEMGGDPRYYVPIERIEVNPESTPEIQEEKVWSFYWPQVYLDLIQNGRETQDGQSYAQALGLQGSVTREAIWQVLLQLEGNWPWIPHHYKEGTTGLASDWRTGFANPNLPIEIVPLPRYMLPAMFGNKPEPWIRIDSYGANRVVPNGAVGLQVVPETGKIRLYGDIDDNSVSIAMLLYMTETVFITSDGIRPGPRGIYEPWYFEWWENYLKGSPDDFSVIQQDKATNTS